MEAELGYVCMCFGWYQELLEEARVADFAAAEARLLEMLDRGGMIVHVYRDTDIENPELVGRHRRLRSFTSGAECACSNEAVPHEVERFLLDRESLDAWARASKTDGVLEKHWSVVDVWPIERQEQPGIYGRAMLIASQR